MPGIGEITKGTEISYSRNCKYIWHPCSDCGKERWVRLGNNKPRSLQCKSCAEKGKHWKKGKVIKSGYVVVWLDRMISSTQWLPNIAMFLSIA